MAKVTGHATAETATESRTLNPGQECVSACSRCDPGNKGPVPHSISSCTSLPNARYHGTRGRQQGLVFLNLFKCFTESTLVLASANGVLALVRTAKAALLLEVLKAQLLTALWSMP